MSGPMILAAAAMAALAATWAGGAETVGDVLEFASRRRVADRGAAGVRVVEEPLRWEPAKTALIICDVWDRHWCAGASQRVERMAPRMNELAAALRRRGVLVIHCPSDTMDFYRDMPQRRLARSAPPAKDAPPDIGRSCRALPGEPPLPVDASDGGCDCQPQCRQGRAWKKQIDTVHIADNDAITDSGAEVWNLLSARGVENVVFMGVHVNMCVVARPFGLRNLVRGGKRCVLVRDLTDAMYNSRMPPQVSHERGTEMVVEHIERHICPSTTSADLLAAARSNAAKE